MNFLKTALATLPILASTAFAEPSLPQETGVFNEYTEIKAVVADPKPQFIETIKEKYQPQFKAFLNEKHKLYIYDPLNKRLLNYDDYLSFIKEHGLTYMQKSYISKKAICEQLFFGYQDLVFGEAINNRLILKDKGVFIYLSNNGNLDSLFDKNIVHVIIFNRILKEYKAQCLEDFNNTFESVETKRQLELLK